MIWLGMLGSEAAAAAGVGGAVYHEDGFIVHEWGGGHQIIYIPLLLYILWTIFKTNEKKEMYTPKILRCKLLLRINAAPSWIRGIHTTFEWIG